ncbi:MAG: hypothetical protein JXQ75_21490 [Phycisphaerae bacterium]|nr:hypothetical protein [Phycisphaerae bacterium]
MARVCGACCGLLVFSAMIVCGMLAGNPIQNIITRALLGLIGGFTLGSLVGWIGLFVVKENADVSRSDDAVEQPAHVGSPDEAGASSPSPRTVGQPTR